VTCQANQYSKFFPLVEEPHGMVLARTKLRYSHAPGTCIRKRKVLRTQSLKINNVMDPNIYLNATVFSRLAQRDQKLKLQAVPEPEFKPFDLAYLTNAPAKRGQSRNTSRNGEAQHNLSDALPA
jgi:hypothetical protein